MKPASDPALLAALNAERAALLSFVALLEREQGMLVENNAEQLLELSEKKSTEAIRLNELANIRRTLLKKYLPQLGVEAIRNWLSANNPESLSVWKEILVLAERAAQTNRTNGELIQMKLRHNQQALTALSNAANKANLYGPDGQTSFSPGSGRSLGSG